MLTLPHNDHDIQTYERENYPIGGNGIIPTWLKGESKAASKYQTEWVEGMTAEEREKHLQREKEYQQSLGNNKYY
jgi:hypothetical protein